mgnify:FL=1
MCFQREKIQKVIFSSLGFSPKLEQIEISNSYKRFDTSKKGHLNGYFKVFFSDDSLCCYFGDWSTGKKVFWKDKEETICTLSNEERIKIQRIDIATKQREEKERRALLHKHEQFFYSLPLADSIGVIHPYLMEKCLPKSYIGRYDKESDSLVFPFFNSKGQFSGYQSISITGRKMIANGSYKKGSFCVFRFADSNSIKTYACEGYATGISILEATKGIVIVCIDSENLTEGIRNATKYLNVDSKNVLIISDNDFNKTGETESIKACSSLGCNYFLIPKEGMDANDYACNYGVDKLLQLIKGI